MARGLVLADRLQHLAERRMDDAPDQQEAGQEDDGHERVHRHRLGQVDDAEEPAARHRLDAVLAAGELRLQGDEEDHLRQRQGDHREVDALAADREQAGDRAEHERDRRAEQDRELGREAPDLGRVRRRVAGRAEEHRVAEREQAAEADQQVEGAREQREAHHLHHEHRIDDERREHQQRHHDREGDALRAQVAAARRPAAALTSAPRTGRPA